MENDSVRLEWRKFDGEEIRKSLDHGPVLAGCIALPDKIIMLKKEDDQRMLTTLLALDAGLKDTMYWLPVPRLEAQGLGAGKGAA